MKSIIVVINCLGGNKEKWESNSNSLESIRWASQRWGVDFFEMIDVKYKRYNPDNGIRNIRNSDGICAWNGFAGTKMWQLVWIMENFLNYDRVLVIDSDVVINSKAPNPFGLIDDYDFGGVLDGNPGRFVDYEDDYFRNRFSKRFSVLNGCLEYLSRIPGFTEKNYWNNYINTGVLLFKTKSMSQHVLNLKKMLLDPECLKNYIENHDSPIDQNLTSAWISTLDIKIRILDNEWNWIAPDTAEEYNGIFAGRMVPWIYHFCGTGGVKDSLKIYDRWK